MDDMYQMFGYHMIYNARCAVLLYPYVHGRTPKNEDNLEFVSEFDVTGTAGRGTSEEVRTKAVVKVKFADLFDLERSIEELKEIFVLS